MIAWAHGIVGKKRFYSDNREAHGLALACKDLFEQPLSVGAIKGKTYYIRKNTDWF